MFFDAKHAVTHIDFDESKNLLLTSGYDRVIKVSLAVDASSREGTDGQHASRQLWEADGLLEETRN